jgi:hypothetical protein
MNTAETDATVRHEAGGEVLESLMTHDEPGRVSIVPEVVPLAIHFDSSPDCEAGSRILRKEHSLSLQPQPLC